MIHASCFVATINTFNGTQRNFCAEHSVLYGEGRIRNVRYTSSNMIELVTTIFHSGFRQDTQSAVGARHQQPAAIKRGWVHTATRHNMISLYGCAE